MILRKDKKKRKHSDKSEEDDNGEKYRAYVKKTPKKKSGSKNKKGIEATSSTYSIESSSERRVKKKKKREIKVEEVQISVLSKEETKVNDNIVTICAEPKINEAALKLNAKISSHQDIFCAMENVKKQSSSKMTKRNTKTECSLEASSNIELITPAVSLEPECKQDNPKTGQYHGVQVRTEGKSSLTQLSKKNTSSDIKLDETDMDSFPIIVEANLKKSSNSYIPKSLQDHEDVIKKKETDGLNKLQKEEERPKKQSQSPKAIENSVVSDCTNADARQDPNSDISQALQDFYNEVTKGFEALTESKSSRKSKKKAIDKSSKDSGTLKDLVDKNTHCSNSSISENNVAQFFSLESKVILFLQPKTEFSILGKLKLRVLYGAVELYGCIFNPQNTVMPVEIYSPRGYSSISITTSISDNTYDKEALWDVLTMEGVDRSLKTKLHDAVSDCEPGWSVLLMQNFENTLTNFLNNHCTFKLFPKLENIKYSWCNPKRAEYVLQAIFQFHNSENEISISPQWNEKVTKKLLVQWNSTKSLCAMITGGKGVGKSTTARYLINNLLKHSEKVVLLDLDPGQAEMTPAGCISLNIIDKPLLGPNFTHLKSPFYQLYLEDINVTNCITRYIECVKKLVECLISKKDFCQYPIIVNTMGFCKGIGLEICIFLIKLIEPNNVIQILSKRPRNNFDFALLPQAVNKKKTFSITLDEEPLIFEKICDYELQYINSMAEGKRQFETWNMEPRQQRELVLLSYLSQIIQNADDKSFCNFTSNTINNIIPYELSFSSFYLSLIKSSVSATHMLAAMNGNIVALCGIDLENNSITADKENLNYPLVVIKPPACTCYGYGIVRGIDMKRRCVYVNTPLTRLQLRHVNLLSGCSAVPFALLHPGGRVAGPYAADRGELPTSRETRRGFFRVDQGKVTA